MLKGFLTPIADACGGAKFEAASFVLDPLVHLADILDPDGSDLAL